MADDSPAPLTPIDCDLRDFAFMPLLVARLRRSKAWLMAKRQPELGFYMINLWTAAWHDFPAASVEDDDDVLMDLAMCDAKRWKAVREKVLHGWIKCSDGRLYHPTVAEQANDSWAGRQGYRERLAKARAAKAQKQLQISYSPAIESVTEHITDTVTAPIADTVIGPAIALKGQGQGQGQGESKQAARAKPNGTRSAANGAGPPRWTDARIEPCGLDPTKPPDHPDNLRDRDRPCCNGVFLDYATERLADITGLEVIPINDKTLLAWLADGYALDVILDAIRPIVERAGTGKPLAYFDRPVRERAPTFHPLHQHAGAA